MKALLVLSALVATGIGGGYATQQAIPPQEPTAVVSTTPAVVTISPLERARQASFDIVLVNDGFSGSAVLISRMNLEDGSYRYRALTADHVIESMAKDIATNGVAASREMTLTFQLDFHGAPIQITLNVDDIGWSIPAHDWASFTFDSELRLECADVASQEDFETIKAFEPIYLVACGGPFGQQCRKGIISATHNAGVYPLQQLMSPYPWNQSPENFFRYSMPIWYGDSGGPIFSKEGKLIGIVNALTMGGRGGPVPHSGVALKAHVVRDIVAASKDFFLVED